MNPANLKSRRRDLLQEIAEDLLRERALGKIEMALDADRVERGARRPEPLQKLQSPFRKS